jgi:hypothetical protein
VSHRHVAFIGCGQVGSALADRLQRLGHHVVVAAADPASESVRKALARNAALQMAPPREAVERAEVVFLCTPFQANQAALQGLGAALAGKVLVDCTNPVGPGLTHGLGSVQSGAERVQELAPGARVVKAFSVYGYENFEDNHYPCGQPAMFFCGDDAQAKHVVGTLIAELGWEPLDVGGLVQALHLEHMTLLWVRLVRAGGASPHLVWAALRR